MTQIENKENATLSAGWYTYRKILNASVGADSEITVSDLIPDNTGNFSISVTVKNAEKAQVIATLLNSEKKFGNIKVTVGVLNAQGERVTPLPDKSLQDEDSALKIANLFNQSFKENPFFENAIAVIQRVGVGSRWVVAPIFNPEVIQFFNDDLSNYYQSFTEVAAKGFKDVMKEKVWNIPILFSTSKNENE